MATVHVERVWVGWPEFEGDPEQAQVDCLIDGTGNVRMGYLAADLVDSAAVQTLLTEDKDIITSPAKQRSAPYPEPDYGTDRPDLVPADFTV